MSHSGSHSRALRSRAPLIAILLTIVAASCTSRPGIDVSVSGVAAATTLVSQTERSLCSATHGDAFPQTIPLTTVRTTAPVSTRFRSATFVSEIRGWVYEDRDGRPAGEPIEEFSIRGSEGEFVSKSIRPGATYNFLVNAAWGFAVSGGEETRAFRVRVDAP